MPAFTPTNQDREIVGLAKAMGMDHETIARLVFNPRTSKHINRETLEKAFAQELAIAASILNLKICRSLVGQALAGNMTAIIWYQKNRMGWSDNLAQTGKNGEPIEREHTLRIELVRPKPWDDDQPQPKQITGNGRARNGNPG